jgi:pimeloyl-ACP methyl ester carboxylesterase
MAATESSGPFRGIIAVENKAGSRRPNLEIPYQANFQWPDPAAPWLFCFHGNSSSGDVFASFLLWGAGLNVVAPDLPGNGRGPRLPSYTMDSVGQIMADFVRAFAPKSRVAFFGHSLGGHLLGFIPFAADLDVLAGAPPLRGPQDYPGAFRLDSDATAVIPLLSKATPFSGAEAVRFVAHQLGVGPGKNVGIARPGIEEGAFTDFSAGLVADALAADGKFRAGCLATLASRDQVAWMRGRRRVVLIHAARDGVISLDYLQNLPMSLLFKEKVFVVESPHLCPVLAAQAVLDIVRQALGPALGPRPRQRREAGPA